MAEELRPDIQAAKDRMSSRIGANREMRKLVEYLWHGEQVTHLVSGAYGGGVGLVVLTDRRMLFLKDGWTSQTVESFPFEKVSSVQWSGGMMMGKIIVFASGNKAEITQVPKPDGKAMVDALNNVLAGAPQPAAPPAPSPAPQPPAPQVPPVPPSFQQAAVPAQDPLGAVPSFELVRALRDRGVVTPDEFAFIAQRL
ncbi:PH domain-containing protein [Nocardiopsis suaedae]|uniref:PH domain-containing protein n=1 Tax=Nocardiopsis suaedae TaxID=3018444 RepID=A0ABT4TM03_9ACTN|nr:PH domain-containing protein [Nocardiopsis suaedae]MDA2805717.1 PH domain-containing protein [Nocardiopsis suaedae]